MMKKALIFIAGGGLFLAVVVSAQTQARITGKVVDQAGNPVAGASIRAEDLATSAVYEDITNKKGRFIVGVVNGANPHRLTISMDRYQVLTNEVSPGAGGIFQQVFTLYPEGTRAAPGSVGVESLEGGGAAVRLYNRGAELYNQGDKLAAQERLLEALTEDPSLAEAHKVLSAIALERQDPETALEHAEKYLAAQAGEPAGLMLKFDALNQLDRHGEAAQLIPALAVAQPTTDTAARAFNAAAALYRDGDLATAVELLESALSIDPEQTRSLLLLADIRQRQEQYEAALELSRRLLALEPDNVRALAIQHHAYIKTGDRENARAAFDRLAAADPESVAETFAEEGARLFSAGQIQAAIEVLEQSLELDPDNVDANYQLGVAYVGEERPTEARQLLSHFLELAPDHPEAESARAMLEYLE